MSETTSDRVEMKELVNRMAVPCRDDGVRFTDESRLRAIAGELGMTGWMVWQSDSLCRIYAREGFEPSMPTIVLSSHVDMVARCCYADCNGDVWKGSFDNLITNAALVWNMRGDKFGPQVLVAFTGDEEIESRGADQVVRILKENKVDVRYVIVTDVTEEGWDRCKSFTFENLFPDDAAASEYALSRMLPAAKGLDDSPVIIFVGDPDEAWEYDEFDIRCCSVCLPCHGDMHSERGVEVRAESVLRYAEALGRICSAWLPRNEN